MTLCTALSAGLKALSDTTLPVEGGSIPKTDVTGPLDAFVAAATAVGPAQAAYRGTVQKKRDAQKAARAAIALVVPYLKIRYGKHNPELESLFGVTPDKVPQPKVAAKAAGAAKGAAKRKAMKAASDAVKNAPAPASPAPAAAPVSVPTPVTPATKG